MDVLKAIYERRAIRRFFDAEIRGSVVLDLLRAAAQAPAR
jgi:nitroreductase